MPEPKQRGGLLSWKSYSKADDFPPLCQTTQGPTISGCNVLVWTLHVLASVRQQGCVWWVACAILHN